VAGGRAGALGSPETPSYLAPSRSAQPTRLAAFNELAELLRPLSHGPDRGAYLSVLFDGLANLLVEDATIRNDDDRVKERGFLFLQANELVGQPSDRV